MEMVKAKCFNLWDIYYNGIFIGRFPKKEALDFISRSHKILGGL